MKFNIKKFNITHWSKILVSFISAIALSYFIISIYIHYSNAGVFKLASYLSLDKDQTLNLGYPECPKLMKVEGTTGAIIIRDECTNLYWNRLDLPLQKKVGNNYIREGYTWQEAKDYCEGLATIYGIDDPIFRLPTADELLSLTYTPCLGSSSTPCSPITAKNAKFKDINGADSADNLLPSPDAGYFYEDSSNIKFAQGAYWTKDELDTNGKVDPDDPPMYEAASSVNMYYGIVNNPVFAKGVRLNVRCIMNNPLNVVGGKKVTATNYNINELQWWHSDSSGCNDGSMKLSLGIRKNLTPRYDDYRNCPEGLQDVTGKLGLYAGVSEMTNECQYFSCPNSKKYVKNDTSSPPVKCE